MAVPAEAMKMSDPTKEYIELEVKVPWWQNHALYHWLAFFVALLVLWTCFEIYPLIPEAPQGLPPNYFTQP